ncbi:uncharacterized protein LOC122962589 [Acropora millepora]|uniref:uncharacterized protein LOC122962589 n=1 Tax=Acropora millepora TaxID=45264 RepID=UPI001CF31C38|nr:uncharacterized protein LOC122962589 [Acropora millepora]
MSTQLGILSKFASKKLWTVPSKEQYLPAYFKRLCDDYVNSGDARRVFPVECLGLQRSSAPPTWVLGSNLHVVLDDVQVAERVPERLSPYAVLGNESHPLPFVNIQGMFINLF